MVGLTFISMSLPRRLTGQVSAYKNEWVNSCGPNLVSNGVVVGLESKVPVNPITLMV